MAALPSSALGNSCNDTSPAGPCPEPSATARVDKQRESESEPNWCISDFRSTTRRSILQAGAKTRRTHRRGSSKASPSVVLRSNNPHRTCARAEPSHQTRFSCNDNTTFFISNFRSEVWRPLVYSSHASRCSYFLCPAELRMRGALRRKHVPLRVKDESRKKGRP